MIVICYALLFEAGYVYSLGFSMKDFKSVIRARIEYSEGRDTWHYRVPKGQSCFDASRDRGKDIAYCYQKYAVLWQVWFIGRKSAQNINWTASPNIILPAGTYTVIDSDPATWSQNSQSKGCGFTRVEGFGQ